MAAEFIAEEGILRGLVLTLEDGEEWIIGRDPEQSSLVIEDPKVSRRHAICRKTETGYLIENLSEINPVQINDRVIDIPTLLHDGDLVKIGENVFSFHPEGVAGDLFISMESEAEGDEDRMTPTEHEWEEPLSEEDEIAEREATPEAEPEPIFSEIIEEPIEREDEFYPEDLEQDTIYKEAEEIDKLPESSFDLGQTTRFILKVIAGPNTGAEFALDLERNYLIGTDATTCDIVFNDLSVSREHARLIISPDGIVTIEDLESRNGVVVDRERVEKRSILNANAVVSLGTSVFLLIDREAPQETIMTPIFEPEPIEEEVVAEGIGVQGGEAPAVAARPSLSTGALILALIISGLAILFGVGVVSLFQTKEVVSVPRDYQTELAEALKDFTGVKYTFNKTSGKLFLVGHVRTGVEKNELLYKLQGLTFIKGMEDNIVNDEAIWQEMNILLSKQADFRGVSMHSPEPGVFVLNGYLETTKQSDALNDYMNVHFNYLNKLQNRVVVEQLVVDEVTSTLTQKGFEAVNASFKNGELILTGYVSTLKISDFQNLVDQFSKIQGVRALRNFVVEVSPEQGVVDLNKRFPGRYRVTGYSKHGDVNVNVVINGRILTRGDAIDGMTITSIQPRTIFLEKEGLKYKIEYNK